jgi:hypothetical protein
VVDNGRMTVMLAAVRILCARVHLRNWSRTALTGARGGQVQVAERGLETVLLLVGVLIVSIVGLIPLRRRRPDDRVSAGFPSAADDDWRM